MPNLYQSDQAKSIASIPYPACAGDVVAQRISFVFPAAIALGDIVEMGVLPPGCRLVDAILDTDDLDSNGVPTIKFDVGLMSGTFGDNDPTRTCGAEILSAVTTPQAGGVVRPTLATAFRTAPSNVEQPIGIKINTAAATGVAGTVGLTLLYATA